LFNAAFVSVWSELGPEHQTSLAANLETALNSAQDITEITQTILNLAEFMDHCDKVSCTDVHFFLVLVLKRVRYFIYMNYGHEEGRLSLFVRFVTILNPISLLSLEINLGWS
jgi:phosphatidylinositol kinase/protein kinase (PI-3  family)